MKQRTILRGAVLAVLLFSSTSCWAWWNADWTNRVKITLNTAADGVPITGAVESFPVLVRLHAGNFSFAEAKPDGTDIRFLDEDDKTPLQFHIDKFDGVTEIAVVWVKVPKLAPGVKTGAIWMYYGNQKAGPAGDSKSTYDTPQLVALHFGDGAALPQDVTAYANHAVQAPAVTPGAGLIDGGALLSATSRIALPASASLKFGPAGLTVSMWVKPTDVTRTATLYSQQDGQNVVSLTLAGGALVGRVNGATTAAGATVSRGTWHHVALVIKESVLVYLDGKEVGRAPAPQVSMGGTAEIGQGLTGELDEVGVAAVARSADWIALAAASQGLEQKLVAYGQPENGEAAGGSPSYLKILLNSVTPDGWVVIVLLMVMMVVSIVVMITKTIFVVRTDRSNRAFKSEFEALVTDLTTLDANASESERVPPVGGRPAFASSSLFRIYHDGTVELKKRFAVYREKGMDMILTPQSINAIRATLDASFVRELQRLNAQMVLLTIAIAGGPFLGLLGTVVGVMITFAAIAAAGDVNVNAIAPGIAAALVATVAGLAVAIPSLFGYNYLASRIKEISSDMQVFVDEFITKLAENYSI